MDVVQIYMTAQSVFDLCTEHTERRQTLSYHFMVELEVESILLCMDRNVMQTSRYWTALMSAFLHDFPLHVSKDSLCGDQGKSILIILVYFK